MMSNQVQQVDYQTLLIEAQQGNPESREKIALWMIGISKNHAKRVIRTKQLTVAESSLVSNVLVKLIRGNTIERAPDIYYLIASITRATRQIICDHFRSIDRVRRSLKQATLTDAPWFQKVVSDQNIDHIDLENAIDQLQQIHPRKAAIVNLRFYCEMSTTEVAKTLGISESTVENDSRLARIWLYKRMNSND